MGAPQKSILKDYMRDAYEEFADLLCEELRKVYPRDRRTTEKVKEVMKKIMEREFGKDRDSAPFSN